MMRTLLSSGWFLVISAVLINVLAIVGGLLLGAHAHRIEGAYFNFKLTRYFRKEHRRAERRNRKEARKQLTELKEEIESTL